MSKRPDPDKIETADDDAIGQGPEQHQADNLNRDQNNAQEPNANAGLGAENQQQNQQQQAPIDPLTQRGNEKGPEPLNPNVNINNGATGNDQPAGNNPNINDQHQPPPRADQDVNGQNGQAMPQAAPPQADPRAQQANNVDPNAYNGQQGLNQQQYANGVNQATNGFQQQQHAQQQPFVNGNLQNHGFQQQPNIAYGNNQANNGYTQQQHAYGNFHGFPQQQQALQQQPAFGNFQPNNGAISSNIRLNWNGGQNAQSQQTSQPIHQIQSGQSYTGYTDQNASRTIPTAATFNTPPPTAALDPIPQHILGSNNKELIAAYLEKYAQEYAFMSMKQRALIPQSTTREQVFGRTGTVPSGEITLELPPVYYEPHPSAQYWLKAGSIKQCIPMFDPQAKPQICFSHIWQSILFYAQDKYFTEANYILILKTVCQGEATQQLLQLADMHRSSLAEILEHFEGMYVIKKTRQDRMNGVDFFARQPNENLVKAMNRAKALMLDIRPLIGNESYKATKDILLEKALKNILAPRTLARLNTIETEMSYLHLDIDTKVKMLDRFEKEHNLVPQIQMGGYPSAAPSIPINNIVAEGNDEDDADAEEEANSIDWENVDDDDILHVYNVIHQRRKQHAQRSTAKPNRPNASKLPNWPKKTNPTRTQPHMPRSGEGFSSPPPQRIQPMDTSTPRPQQPAQQQLYMQQQQPYVQQQQQPYEQQQQQYRPQTTYQPVINRPPHWTRDNPNYTHAKKLGERTNTGQRYNRSFPFSKFTRKLTQNGRYVNMKDIPHGVTVLIGQTPYFKCHDQSCYQIHYLDPHNPEDNNILEDTDFNEDREYEIHNILLGQCMMMSMSGSKGKKKQGRTSNPAKPPNHYTWLSYKATYKMVPCYTNWINLKVGSEVDHNKRCQTRALIDTACEMSSISMQFYQFLVEQCKMDLQLVVPELPLAFTTAQTAPAQIQGIARLRLHFKDNDGIIRRHFDVTLAIVPELAADFIMGQDILANKQFVMSVSQDELILNPRPNEDPCVIQFIRILSSQRPELPPRNHENQEEINGAKATAPPISQILNNSSDFPSLINLKKSDAYTQKPERFKKEYPDIHIPTTEELMKENPHYPWIYHESVTPEQRETMHSWHKLQCSLKNCYLRGDKDSKSKCNKPDCKVNHPQHTTEDHDFLNKYPELLDKMLEVFSHGAAEKQAPAQGIYPDISMMAENEAKMSELIEMMQNVGKHKSKGTNVLPANSPISPEKQPPFNKLHAQTATVVSEASQWMNNLQLTQQPVAYFIPYPNLTPYQAMQMPMNHGWQMQAGPGGQHPYIHQDRMNVNPGGLGIPELRRPKFFQRNQPRSHRFMPSRSKPVDIPVNNHRAQPSCSTDIEEVEVFTTPKKKEVLKPLYPTSPINTRTYRDVVAMSLPTSGESSPSSENLYDTPPSDEVDKSS